MLRIPQPVARWRANKLPVVQSVPDGGPPPATAGETTEDERLMIAAQRGDLSAFNDLVSRHERAVYSVCLRLLRDPGLAEDAGQDTFIRAWNAIDTFRGGLVRPWLLRIATNRAYDMLRAKARRPAQSLDAELYEIEPEWTSQVSIADHPEAFASRSELSVLLERTLGQLPDDQRLAIILSDVQGYGYEEIAQITGVAIGTVKSRISRGRSRLRDLLNANDASRELLGRYTRFSSDE